MISTEKIKKHNAEQMLITIVAKDEESLYLPFSPEPEFSNIVQWYIKDKVAGEDIKKSIRLHVISREPLDEGRFRTASSNWIRSERKKFREEERETLRLLTGMLIFGSLFVILSIALANNIGVIEHTLIPIIGSLALSRAAGIMVIDMPTLRAKRWMLDGMEKNNVISFEYKDDDKEEKIRKA